MLFSMLLLATSCPAEPGTPQFERYVSAGICERPPVKPKPDKIGPITEDEKAAVRNYFDAILFDGLSARWKYTRGKGDVICGTVNAKNRMGAYTGWVPYYFSGGTGRIANDETSIYFTKLFCLGSD